MILHFDSTQQYQLDAIKAVTNLFEGQSSSTETFESSPTYGSLGFSENGFYNQITLAEEQIWENAKQIQLENKILNAETTFQGMHFSIEMETGTGKTYVYLRTIYELNRLYGFLKFVIVVPSIAIREGVIKNLKITHDHFQDLYERVPVDFYVYDSKSIPTLRGFAASNSIQILVINIDSFAKDENIINKPNDRLSGKRPIEFIQSCSPIVIIDEPQNVKSENRVKAIENLNPLCTLRYSATHTNPYNLLYSLNPVTAYNLGLVKQIEVDSVVSENSINHAFIEVEQIVSAKNKLAARISIDVNTDKGPIRKTLLVNSGDDLYKKSNHRELYEDGFKIDEINIGENTVSFTNGMSLHVGQKKDDSNDEVMKFMIRRTVEEHLRKEIKLKSKGIKVLSLFFIDKVKNYRQYDQAGKIVKGKFAEWFEEIYNEEASKPKYKDIFIYPPEAIHNGYFSIDGKGRIKDTGGETVADDQVYKLIMERKEELLDEQTPLRFIFSHSTLREGWDNPNVFQICTLNESTSTIRKRQEIGRGLRLPVDQSGQRIFDKNINQLTIIANESYDQFAKSLQNEIQEECGIVFTGIKNKADRKKVLLRKGFKADPKFLQIWEKIKYQKRYSVKYDTSKLVQHAAAAMSDFSIMPETKEPAIRSKKVSLSFTDSGIEKTLASENFNDKFHSSFDVPDILAYIQQRTNLTRSTISHILKQSARLNEFLVNPQMFMDNAVTVIKTELNKLMIDGIKYEKVNDKIYELSLFNDSDLEVYYDNGVDFDVSNPDKTIYENLIPLDSKVENQFARDCESVVNVEFYFKLPADFVINTPIGNYNPDWAVVVEDSKKIFFIVETKGKDQELRPSELMKIKCGRAYFNGLDGISYIRASEVSELYN